MAQKLKAYLQLCRPANLPTAAADILAGLAISGVFYQLGSWQFPFLYSWRPILLVLSSIFLYAGGVTLNDVFDADLDAVERPERPIPRGSVSIKQAQILGYSLLSLGVISAFLAQSVCGIVAIALATAILSYDKYAKHHPFIGPLNMGVCRGLNLLMGILYLNTLEHWPYTLIPVAFIFAITMISRGEVHGNNKTNIVIAAGLYALVVSAIVGLHYTFAKYSWWYLIFVILFAIMVYLPLLKAYKINSPENIKKAVKSGVIAIIILDAAFAVAYTNIIFGLLVLLLLPLSIFLAKRFAVT
ncbi:UbiA-like protein EboC [Flavobacterium sp. ASW18X]|uniref:UbiA-like protein EboC n=1 Tax=Flavobacterium sp. ASW18X TaxID=2572595 RepID=UPI0010AE1A90|nr:UbiA-like protein EboC [Flavobacterium sp. ASW18X]TKD63428.1 ubiquinone biosynthesis protein UbiA [Flavobacterium sp. ASW18X]